MSFVRRRIGRLFENLLAFAIGAVVVALVQGMTPAEIVDLALSNAHKLPDMLRGMVTGMFAAELGLL